MILVGPRRRGRAHRTRRSAQPGGAVVASARSMSMPRASADRQFPRRRADARTPAGSATRRAWTRCWPTPAGRAGAARAMDLARARGVPGVVDAEAPAEPDVLARASHVAFSRNGLAGVHRRRRSRSRRCARPPRGCRAGSASPTGPTAPTGSTEDTVRPLPGLRGRGARHARRGRHLARRLRAGAGRRAGRGATRSASPTPPPRSNAPHSAAARDAPTAPRSTQFLKETS